MTCYTSFLGNRTALRLRAWLSFPVVFYELVYTMDQGVWEVGDQQFFDKKFHVSLPMARFLILTG